MASHRPPGTAAPEPASVDGTDAVREAVARLSPTEVGTIGVDDLLASLRAAALRAAETVACRERGPVLEVTVGRRLAESTVREHDAVEPLDHAATGDGHVYVLEHLHRAKRNLPETRLEPHGADTPARSPPVPGRPTGTLTRSRPGPETPRVLNPPDRHGTTATVVGPHPSHASRRGSRSLPPGRR